MRARNSCPAPGPAPRSPISRLKLSLSVPLSLCSALSPSAAFSPVAPRGEAGRAPTHDSRSNPIGEVRCAPDDICSTHDDAGFMRPCSGRLRWTPVRPWRLRPKRPRKNCEKGEAEDSAKKEAEAQKEAAGEKEGRPQRPTRPRRPTPAAAAARPPAPQRRRHRCRAIFPGVQQFDFVPGGGRRPGRLHTGRRRRLSREVETNASGENVTGG